MGSCSDPEPILLGFIGGLSDRNADIGPAALKAVQLAVEQVNRTGGIQGRLVELVAKDDAQRQEVAAQSAQELADLKVDAVIGPFTSSMAEVIVPILGQAGIFEVSPSISSLAFYGKDDNLFRINRTTRDNTRDYARVMTSRGQRRFAVAYDLRNRNFTESWLEEFRGAVAREGGSVVAAVPYESLESTNFADVIARMLKADPDSLFFLSSAVDVGRLAQEARAQAPSLPIGASEWAATEQLAKLGGSVVEGLLIIQNFNRRDTSPRFVEFVDAYRQHFERFPGYTAVMAYDAATVVLTALKNRRPGEDLKSAALRSGPYQGLQQEIVFDANGDTQRKVAMTEIHDGEFVEVHP
jgi:branched-chain amino acid transport system substrate-binding protein